LPKWFVRQFFQWDEDRSYCAEIGNLPILNRYGSLWEPKHFPPAQLPCCIPCNGTLSSRFEQPANSVIRRLFADDGTVTLDSTEAELVGMWLLKTSLFSAHPELRQESRSDSTALSGWNLTVIPDDLYSWMVNDQSPPAGLSVWISRVRDPEPDNPPSQRIFLPRVIADGRTIQFQVRQLGIRFLDVALAYHPGWPIEHPLEADGRVVRIWPYSGSGAINVAALPVISRQAIAWTTGPAVHFAPGMYGEVNLPPLTAGMDWMFRSVPGVVRVRH